MGALATLFPAIFGSYGGVSDMSNPALWLQDALGSRRTTSGESVTEATAMSLPAYFAGVRCISEDIAKLPFKVYKPLVRGKELIRDHPVNRLMNFSPNPEMTSMTFRQTLQGWALGWGDGFAEIERSNSGEPINLWPIHPSRVLIKRVNNRLMYHIFSTKTTLWDRERVEAELESENILHLHGLGNDGVRGYSVLRIAAESLGLALAAQTMGAAFFGNGTHTGGVLSHPGKLTEEAKGHLRTAWMEMHSGARSSGKPAILQEGMKWEQSHVNPNDAQFLETRSFQVEEIARWFRIPPHKLQHLAHATFSNIEEQNREYVDDALMPWAERWEQEIKRKLIPERESEVFAEHNFMALLRGNQAARSTYYKELFNMGAISPNDIREQENMNPIPGPEGDVYYIQLNMSTLENIAEGPDDEELTPDVPPEPATPAKNEPKPEPEKAMGAVFSDIASRCTGREIKAIESLKKDGMSPKAFGEWANKFYAGHADYLVDSYMPACESASILCGKQAPFAAARLIVDGYCKRHLAQAQAMFAAGLLADTFESWQHNQLELTMALLHAIKESDNAQS